jgi:hypothetical protein
MAAQGLLDASIVQKIVEHYDFLVERTALVSDPVTKHYERLSSEYADTLAAIEAMAAARDYQLKTFCAA